MTVGRANGEQRLTNLDVSLDQPDPGSAGITRTEASDCVGLRRTAPR
jgi:hypothetical protein